MRFGKKAFKAWLQSKDPNDIVGYPGMGCDCPIAMFYKEKMGATAVTVSEYYIEWRKGDEVSNERDVPMWAVWFIERVDNTFAHTIKAYRALHLLKGL